MDSKIFIMDKETGETAELKPDSFSISFDTEGKVPASVKESYKFECKIDIRNFYSSISKLYSQSWECARADELTNKLNDIIEEYHAPGTLRRERRELKRKFDKTLRLLDQHCRKYKLIYSFTNQ